jgi:hypothetical protein
VMILSQLSAIVQSGWLEPEHRLASCSRKRLYAPCNGKSADKWGTLIV